LKSLLTIALGYYRQLLKEMKAIIRFKSFPIKDVPFYPMVFVNYSLLASSHWSVDTATTIDPGWVNNVISILNLTGKLMMVKD
jgi:hypothetical protein